MTAKLEVFVTARRVEASGSLATLHDNVKKYGTVFNTVAPGTVLEGILRRAS